MKHNILTSISGACLLSALVLAGCTKALPAPSGYPEDGVVRISTGAPVTKAEGDAGAYNGSTLGLYVNYGDGDAYTKHNIQWTKDADSGEWTPAKQMLWKNPTATPTLWAYAPYSASQAIPINSSAFGQLLFTIPADQSAGIDAADFVIWGQENYVLDHNTNPSFSADGKVQINFSHALVKLTFDFTIRTQFEPGTTISKVTLNGTSSTVGCDIFNSSVAATSDATSDITLHKVDDTHYDCIFFPGEGQKAGQKMLTVEMSDGTELTYTVGTSGLSFESGKSYTMKMYLGRLAVELEQVTLDPWTDSGTEIDGGEGIPVSPAWTGTVATGFNSGSGTQDDPYIIMTGEQLAYLAQQVNGGTTYASTYFRLGISIDLGGKEWTPIGNSSRSFQGKFDGNGNSILGLSINNDSYAGLFGSVVYPAYISNVSVVDPIITTTGNRAGAISAHLSNGVITNCSVNGGSITVEGTDSSVGGICGYSIGSSMIKDCTVKGTKIEGVDYAGGLCGKIENGYLRNCDASGIDIESQGSAGGLVAYVTGNTSSSTSEVNKCSVTNSLVSSARSGKDYVGGLIGYCNAEYGCTLSVNGCSANVDIKVAKAAKTGNTSYAYIGGLFGKTFNEGSTLIFSDCHFNGRFLNDENAVIDYNGSSHTNIEDQFFLGAALGVLDDYHAVSTSFTGCSYNADKTGNLPIAEIGTIDSGITAEHLGN